MTRDMYQLIMRVTEEDERLRRRCAFPDLSADGAIVTRDGNVVPKRTCTRQQFEEYIELLREAAEFAEEEKQRWIRQN
jgi:hypothetical protein